LAFKDGRHAGRGPKARRGRRGLDALSGDATFCQHAAHADAEQIQALVGDDS
jgi:hypothetical protein